MVDLRLAKNQIKGKEYDTKIIYCLPRLIADGTCLVADVILNCMKCDDRFSKEKVPKNLKCGHTMCAVCIKEITDNDDAQCLECRTRIFVEDVSDLPINYPLLKLMGTIKENPSSFNAMLSQVPNSPVIAPVSCSPKKSSDCPKHGSPAAVFCLTCRVWACQDCLVLDHRSPPRGTCRTVSTAEALEKIKAEYTDKTKMSVKLLKLVQNNLASEKAQIDFVTKFCVAEHEHTEFSGGINTALSDIQKMDETTISDAKGALRKLLKSVKKATTLKNIPSYQQKLEIQEKALKDYIKLEAKRKLKLLQEIRQHLSSDLKLLADRGTPLYAVQWVSIGLYSGTRWSQIISKDDHLLVTCLKEGNVPENGLTIPYDYVRKLVPENSPSIFFECGNAGEEASELIVVRLKDDGFTQVQFVVFHCTGEGMSNYKGSSLFKEDSMENVIGGGDMENNDGTGSIDFVEGEFYYDKPIKWKSHEISFSCREFSTSKFAFLLHNKFSCIFLKTGWVSRGMEFIRMLSNRKSITGTVVKDCGFVIPIGDEEESYELDGSSEEIETALDIFTLY